MAYRASPAVTTALSPGAPLCVDSGDSKSDKTEELDRHCEDS